MKGPLRSTIRTSAYTFQPIRKNFCSEDVKTADNCLFLELTTQHPDLDQSYKTWESFCLRKKYPYVIAVGTLRCPEKLPEKVYGFFRPEVKAQDTCGKMGEVEAYSTEYLFDALRST